MLSAYVGVRTCSSVSLVTVPAIPNTIGELKGWKAYLLLPSNNDSVFV